jgi:outer membrane receptor protein involved in Fe transport
MKLQFYGLFGNQLTERANWSSTNLESPIDVLSNALQMSHGSSVDLITFYSNFVFVPADIWHNHFSLKFTHALNSNTYYEASIQNTYYNYTLTPGSLRDTTQKYEIVPGFYEDSNPFGYYPYNSNGILINGGQNIARARDHTQVSSSEIKADLVSQVNFENLIKFGISFDYNNLNFDYGIISSQTAGDVYSSRTQMHVFPYRGAVYLQDKLEAKEFTLNAGLRLDYADANVNWWDLDPFNASFFSMNYTSNASFPTSPSKMQWFFSPRLGIAHPITENAKLFFNYGWFRELPQYENTFWLNRSSLNAVAYMGNPNITMQKTISYELGVDYSFNDDFLLQIAGYYKDATNQQTTLNYYASAAGFNYQSVAANNYGDHRGAEFTLRKTSGNWWRGFINYTYDVGSTGHFGPANIYDNVSDQNSYDQATKNLYQDRPIPQPFARANLNFFTPPDFGPKILNNSILGNWMLNLVVDWKAGQWQTWNPNGLLNISYNVQAVDYFNTNLRLQKTIDLGKISLNLFIDMNNVFDTRYLADAASNPYYLAGNIPYMQSLHLPQSNAYENIPGDDKIGDYRKPGVDWQPIENQSQVTINSAAPPPDKMNGTNSIAIYYSITSKDYWWYRNGAWSKVSQSKMDAVLNDKAYIDMPDESTFWFLNPRQIFYGLTVTFNFN